MRAVAMMLMTVAGVGLAGLFGCGGTAAANGSGTMSVHLVDGPIGGYQAINLHIQSVEISGNGGWVTLGTPNRTINLLDLVGGVSETLASGTSLPAGHYQQMRLILGSGNTVVLADGSLHDLKVPSGMQSGIKLTVSFDVAPGTTKDVWIDFDAAHSIQLVQAGMSGQYLLRPTIRACDKLVSGSIHGTLTDAATAAGLPGVQVFAEQLDGSGLPTVVRSTLTDAQGAYTLDLLPMGGTYHVVSQPLVGSTAPVAYEAKASDGLMLTAGTPVFTYSAAFGAATATGGVAGAVSPVAGSTDSDLVNLLQTLSTPTAGSHTFIVRSVMATVGTTSESYGFDDVPVGLYATQGIRTTLSADGSTAWVASPTQPLTITTGVTATAIVGF